MYFTLISEDQKHNTKEDDKKRKRKSTCIEDIRELCQFFYDSITRNILFCVISQELAICVIGGYMYKGGKEFCGYED